MVLELIIALAIGIAVGTLTGLAPGIHINLVAGITIANISLFSGISPLAISVFIASLSITHILIDFIPSIFLGAPDEDTILSVLPGHRLLKEGKGYEAALLTMQGGIVALLIGVICVPLYLLFLDKVQNMVSAIIPFVLIFISLYIIFREERTFVAMSVFLLSGIAGFMAFNAPVKEPLLPLLTGLFGLSGIITSISGNESVPRQRQTEKILLIPLKKYISSIISASIIGPLFSFLPGIGSSHIAVISSEITKQDKKQFLFLNGLASTLAMFLSFVAAYAIGKTRTGSAATIQELLGKIGLNDLIVIISACVLSGIAAYFIGKYIAAKASSVMSKINYKILNISILSVIIIANLFLTNALGVLVLAISTSIGVWAIGSGIKRINLMGSLLIPTILYYLAY